MYIDLNEIQALRRMVVKHIAEGWKWITYPNEDRPLTALSVHGFTSAYDAAESCEQWNLGIDREGRFPGYDYVFKPIENIVTNILFALQGKVPLVADYQEIQALLESAGVQPTVPTAYIALAQGLAKGEIMPVKTMRKIVPANLITSYHLVGHIHRFHSNIYEVGHSTRILETFDTYAEAMTVLKKQPFLFPPGSNEGASNINVVGQLKGQELSMDMEGLPRYNTGITLAIYNHYTGAGTVEHLVDPQKAHDLSHCLYAHYKPGEGKMVLLDDKLETVEPDGSCKGMPEDGFDTTTPYVINLNAEASLNFNVFAHWRDLLQSSGNISLPGHDEMQRTEQHRLSNTRRRPDGGAPTGKSIG